jgi:hypothetical protein
MAKIPESSESGQEALEPDNLSTESPKAASFGTDLSQGAEVSQDAFGDQLIGLGEPEGEPISEDEVKEQAPQQVLQVPLSTLKRRLEAEERRISRLEKQLEKISLQNKARETGLLRVATAKEMASEWLSSVQDSFIWKMNGELYRERENAKSMIDQMEQDVNSVALPEQGELPRLQIAFNKNFLMAWVAPVLIMVVVTIVPWAFTVQPIEELAFMYSPETAAPVILGVVLSLLAISAWLVRLANREKFPAMKFLLWVVGIAGIGYFVYQLNFLEPWLRDEVAPWLASSFFGFLLISLLVLLAGILSGLLVYYSGWSQFRRGVQLEIHKLQNVVKGYVATKEELRRLESLHHQAEGWLSLIASALHRPWKVDPKWLEEPSNSYNIRNTPAALRIARAVETGDSKTSALERIIGEKLLVRGWRNQAFEDMIQRVGQAIGMNSANFNVDSLDNDLPHLPNNHRKIVSAFLQQTAKNEQAGMLDFDQPKVDANLPGGVKPTDKYLREIGLDRIRGLLRDAQMNALRVERPDVEPIGRNQDLVFEFDETGFDEAKTRRSWDEFLSDSLGTVDEAQPPLSPMVFTTQGKSQRVHEKLNSFLLAPARIKATIPNVRAKSVQVVASGDAKPRRVEIIARLDISESVNPEVLSLFAGDDQDQILSDHTGSPVAHVCQECGLLYCVASKDPKAACSEAGRL